MNYKQTIDRFRSIIERYAFEGKAVKDPRNGEIMAELSLTQMEWGNKFKLNEVAGTLDLVADQSLYTVGSNAYNIPSDLHDFKYIELNRTSDPYNLTRVSKDQMNAIYKCDGLPTKWTLYGTDDNRVLELDAIPENSYDVTNYPESRLNYLYQRKLEYFGGKTGTFSDYDETKADFGGSWKIEEVYHGFMIEYSAAKYVGDTNMMIYWEAKAKAQYDNRPTYVNTGLKYNMGIAND